MKKIRSWEPWGFLGIAFLLAGVMLFLGYQAFKEMELATSFGFNGRLASSDAVLVESIESQGVAAGEKALLVAGPLLGTTTPVLLMAGIAVLIILIASSCAVAMSLRTARHLEREVEAKTKDLSESREKLRATLDRLEAAHAFLQTIIDGVAEPIMVIGADYEIRLMNRAGHEFAHGGTSLSKPKFCHQVSHHELAPCKGTGHPCPMEQVSESGQPATFLHEHYQANGEQRFVEVIASPLFGADGTFQGIIEAVRDITARVVTEGDPTKLTEEFAPDKLEQFSSKVVESIQELFARLPAE